MVQAKILPITPKHLVAIDIILAPDSKLKLTSSIINADKYIIYHDKISSAPEPKKPSLAVLTGKASIPAPTEVPATSNIAP